MKQLLLTGFGPFLKNEANPTEQIVNALHNQMVGSIKVEGIVLPVVFGDAAQQIIKQLETTTYDAVIMLGLAASRKEITPERIAINCRNGQNDNAGNVYHEVAIVEDGPDGIFTTLPIQQMVNVLKEKSWQATISNSAGTYVCNDTMYLVNLYIKENNLTFPSGFIHVPNATTEEGLQSLIEGILVCIEALE